MAKGKPKKVDIDSQIARAWYQHCSGVQVNVMDIPMIFKTIREQLERQPGADLTALVLEATAKYRKN